MRGGTGSAVACFFANNWSSGFAPTAASAFFFSFPLSLTGEATTAVPSYLKALLL